MKTRGRVLIVDRTANASSALAELLRDEGYTTEIAADAIAAAAKLEAFTPDLLLADLELPEDAVIELVRRVRRRVPRCVVLGMTAFERGDTEVLQKPIDLEELNTMLARYMP